MFRWIGIGGWVLAVCVSGNGGHFHSIVAEKAQKGKTAIGIF